MNERVSDEVLCQLTDMTGPDSIYRAMAIELIELRKVGSAQPVAWYDEDLDMEWGKEKPVYIGNWEPLYASPPADDSMVQFLRTVAGPAFDREQLRKEAKLILGVK